MGRRGHDALARIFLRQGARSEAFSRPRPHAAPVPRILSNRKKQWQFNMSPLFLEFLMGKRDYACTPWGMPTYKHFRLAKAVLPAAGRLCRYLCGADGIDGLGKLRHESGNPKCANCMVHSGYEATSVNDIFGSIRGIFDAAKATFSRLTPTPVR